MAEISRRTFILVFFLKNATIQELLKAKCGAKWTLKEDEKNVHIFQQEST